MRATGKIVMEVEGDRLILTPSEGLVVATTLDGAGIVMWVWHPMSGWLIHQDGRRGSTDEAASEGSIGIAN